MHTEGQQNSGRQLPENFQPVWELICKHCNAHWSSRGMEAVVMARPAIRCFSTDLPPLNCDVVYQNAPKAYDGIFGSQFQDISRSLFFHSRRFDLVPGGPCDCHVQDLACLGCGNVVGYYIHRPCFRCLAQRFRIKQRGYQHLWTFYQENVNPKVRKNSNSDPVGWEDLFLEFDTKSKPQRSISIHVPDLPSLRDGAIRHRREPGGGEFPSINSGLFNQSTNTSREDVSQEPTLLFSGLSNSNISSNTPLLLSSRRIDEQRDGENREEAMQTGSGRREIRNLHSRASIASVISQEQPQSHNQFHTRVRTSSSRYMGLGGDEGSSNESEGEIVVGSTHNAFGLRIRDRDQSRNLDGRNGLRESSSSMSLLFQPNSPSYRGSNTSENGFPISTETVVDRNYLNSRRTSNNSLLRRRGRVLDLRRETSTSELIRNMNISGNTVSGNASPGMHLGQQSPPSANTQEQNANANANMPHQEQTLSRLNSEQSLSSLSATIGSEARNYQTRSRSARRNAISLTQNNTDSPLTAISRIHANQSLSRILRLSRSVNSFHQHRRPHRNASLQVPPAPSLYQNLQSLNSEMRSGESEQDLGTRYVSSPELSNQENNRTDSTTTRNLYSNSRFSPNRSQQIDTSTAVQSNSELLSDRTSSDEALAYYNIALERQFQNPIVNSESSNRTPSSSSSSNTHFIQSSNIKDNNIPNSISNWLLQNGYDSISKWEASAIIR
ncbi:hypothetical protein BB560_007337 [Smittium megazygosporum]|uniref:Uncharacterized protein n=1 Tax=Smittium megazygosporum TaxID=133381 RepID=A0A2T9XWP0_9FUNG|nr:hypothetical protein BB560_007337 [Smittium megazygosporum]